jgi:hypothetical protein
VEARSSTFGFIVSILSFTRARLLPLIRGCGAGDGWGEAFVVSGRTPIAAGSTHHPMALTFV